MVTDHYSKNGYRMKKTYLNGGSPPVAVYKKNKTGVLSGRHNYDTPSNSPIRRPNRLNK